MAGVEFVCLSTGIDFAVVEDPLDNCAAVWVLDEPHADVPTKIIKMVNLDIQDNLSVPVIVKSERTTPIILIVPTMARVIILYRWNLF